MFTGIIEAIGTITDVSAEGGNRRFTVEAPFASSLKVGQSVAHDGVCLTVERLVGKRAYEVVAVQETLAVTTLREWAPRRRVNLERSLRPDSFMDGHIVQGHVDAVAECVGRKADAGSHRFTFRLPPSGAHPVVYKGSIAINGVSLTVARREGALVEVAVIPLTMRHTTFQYLKAGHRVNVEFDVVGKYVFEWLRQQGPDSMGG